MSVKGSWVRINVTNYCIFMRNFSLSPSLNLHLTYGADVIHFTFWTIIHSVMTGFDPGSLLIFLTTKLCVRIDTFLKHSNWILSDIPLSLCRLVLWPMRSASNSDNRLFHLFMTYKPANTQLETVCQISRSPMTLVKSVICVNRLMFFHHIRFVLINNNNTGVWVWVILWNKDLYHICMKILFELSVWGSPEDSWWRRRKPACI